MARLVGLIISEDDVFRKQVTSVLRSGPVPVSISDDRAPREGITPDVLIVDGRGDAMSSMAAIERLRVASPSATIVNIALQAQPELIIQAMRAGANEFFTWPLPEDTFHEAIRRMAARRESTSGGRPRATTIAFFGVKGGAGTTTVSVNCGVELARLSKRSTVIVDLKPGLGEVSLFLGVRSRYTLLDAIDNLHRLDSGFLQELLGKHKSGLEILAGSDQFDRPAPGDGAAIDEVFRLLAQKFEYIVIDAGSQLTASATNALYAADTICLVANPDVPCVRNTQRLIDRIEQLGVASERVRVLMNRAAEPYPIPPAQIESAIGKPIDHTFPSDYRTVSTALNSGVPLALSGATDIAAQFDAFTRRILDPDAQAPPPASKRTTLGLERLASLW